MTEHKTLIVGSGMHLMARCPTCGDLGVSMVRISSGSAAETIIAKLQEAIQKHERVVAMASAIRSNRGS